MSQLTQAAGQVTSQVLATQLRELEGAGIIQRLAPEQPRQWGLFQLTDRGRSLCLVLDVVAQWGSSDLGGWTAPRF